MALLLHHELQQYRDLGPEDKDHQDEWEAAMDDPDKYVTLLVGQKNDDEQRAKLDEENWHNTFDWEGATQIYFLGCHEVKAHLQWVALRPADAEAYKRFQVGICACFVYVSLTCH